MARLLRDDLGPSASKVATRGMPDLVVRFAALFDDEARFMAPKLGQGGKTPRPADPPRSGVGPRWREEHPR